MSASARYLQSLFGLAGKTAVVTGGSSGIGRAMALALGQAGARVILVARRPQPLSETVNELQSLGVDNSSFVAGDVSDAAQLKSVIAEVEAKLGGAVPDILVNAAGVNRRPHMDATTLEIWETTISANLTAPFMLGQAWGPRMASRSPSWGRIINVVSQQAFRAYGNSGAYGASKGGLVALTRSQAEAWSPRGVLCNAVAPGVVHTPLTEAVFSDPTNAAAHAARTMIGRNGVPGDFGGVAVYLASQASAAVTGQVIFVDGGYSAT
jgi:NAD(P)-dependent dehydrogenase (short-subunit alcohol dehydrogenase family)